MHYEMLLIEFALKPKIELYFGYKMKRENNFRKYYSSQIEMPYCDRLCNKKNSLTIFFF